MDPRSDSHPGPPRETTPPLAGFCDPRFEAVREAFAENLRLRDEPGAGVAAVVEGRTVVDLWGGHRDRARRVPWERDTLVNAYSVGKGVLAILALGLVERRRARLEAPVARSWPGFEEGGKGGLCLRDLLAHRAGLPSLRQRLPEGAFLDWRAMTGALAAAQPWWEPGRFHGYHVNTFGFLVGEALARQAGEGLGSLFRTGLALPAGADFHFGVSPADHRRCAHVHAPEIVLREESQWALAFPPSGDPEQDRMVWHAYFNPSGFSGLGAVNTPRWREACFPSTGAQATARAVARLYDLWLHGRDGTPWVGDTLRREATTPQARGPDRVLGRESCFGLGFQLPTPGRGLGPGPRAHGHFGYGGSLGMADPDPGLAFGFLTSRPGSRWNEERTRVLLEALYGCL